MPVILKIHTYREEFNDVSNGYIEIISLKNKTKNQIEEYFLDPDFTKKYYDALVRIRAKKLEKINNLNL